MELKKYLPFLFTTLHCIFVFSIIPFSHAVNNQTDFINALSEAPATITLTGSFTLNTPVTIPVGKTVVGTNGSNFHNITTTGSGSLTIPTNVRVTNLGLNGVRYRTLASAANGPVLNASSGTTTYNSDVNFSYNTATNNNGGGVFRLTGGSSAIINGNATFVGNRGTFATGGDGGVGTIDNSTLTINGDAQIHNNTATRHGGAFWNRSAGANLTFNSTSTFTNNTTGGSNLGGAIRNDGTLNFVGLASFASNSASTGGAIQNQGNGSNTTFHNGGIFTNNNATSLTNGGGAIRNGVGAVMNFNNASASFTGNQSIGTGGAIQSIGVNSQLNLNAGATFTRNRSTTSNGGAIHNSDNATLNISNGSSFTHNGKNDANATLTLNGGAIWNSSNLQLAGTTLFDSNASITEGGAIFNSGTSTITGSTTFSNNNSVTGGAISNVLGGNFSIIGASDFNNNLSTNNGGAINNLNSTLNLTGNSTFTGNSSSTGSGGAIFNDPGTVVITGNGTFNNNTAALNGGAIANVISSTLRITGNGTFGTNSSTTGSGGAITTESNSHTVIGAYGSFTNNTAALNGGAVNVNNASFNVLDGATFSGNNASSGSGGALYLNNNATATLVANTQNVTFSGNTANGVNNGVAFGSNSILNANANSAGGEVIFLDKITASGGSNVIHLNRTGTWDKGASPNTPTGNGVPTTAPTNGNIRLNADMSGFSGASNSVNLYGGNMYLGSAGTFFNNINFNAGNNSTLNLINSKIDTISLNQVNVDNLNLHVDIDLANKLVDNINASSVGANDTVTIKGINLWNDGDSGVVFVNNSYQLKLTVDPAVQQVTGPVYIYDVMVPDQTVPGGNAVPFANSALLLLRTNEVNPFVRASPTVKQGVQIGIVDNTRMVMNRLLVVVGCKSRERRISVVGRLIALEDGWEPKNNCL